MKPRSASPAALAHAVDRIVEGKLAARQRVMGGRDAAFRRFLEHIAREVPAYRDLRWRGSALASLANQPPISREQVASEPSAYRSRVASPDELIFKSSGTTGPPLSVHYDLPAAAILNSRLYQHVIAALPSLSAERTAGKILIGQVTNKPGRELETTIVPTDPVARWQRYPLDRPETVPSLLRERPAVLYGKALYLRELLDRLSLVNAELRPEAILVSGERLYGDDRLALRIGFGAPVINAYVTSECGVVASSQAGQEDLQTFAELVIVEVLRGSEISSTGEGELLVTSLFNRQQPLLRYRTGDWGQLQTLPDGTQMLRGIRRMNEALPLDCEQAARDFEEAMRLAGIWDFRLRTVGRTGYLLWTSLIPSLQCPTVLASLGQELRFRLRCRRLERLTPAGGKRLRYPRSLSHRL